MFGGDTLHDAAKMEDEEEEDETEINLELSLAPNKLMKASSIASCLPVVQNESGSLVSHPSSHTPLARTSSLPVESDEWAKRKHQQSLRRLEAKRRRSEKQRLLKEEKQASGSSVANRNPQEIIIASALSLGERHRNMVASDVQSRTEQLGTQGGSSNLATSGSIEDMPSVFTIGDDPNGRRVDGILYKYGRGEEVRIMCICHGNFYSPADFIRHAGGTNVDCPLKRIVMNPSSSLF